jgi:uncharacterized protein
MKVLDRTAVLFLGIAVGAVMGFAFAPRQGGASPTAPQPLASAPAQPGKPAPILAAVTAATPALRGPDCAVPFQPRMLSTLAKGDPVTIGVFGDSFGDGVWQALYWRLPRNEHFNVVKFSKEATGFTRYASLNVEQNTRTQLDAQPVDVAVISFGANDIQGIADGGHVYALFTPGWRQVYGERIARMVALLRSRGAMVYWVGLPKMRDPEFDAQVSTLNAFLAERMTALGVPFIDTAPLSVDENGSFNAYLTDPTRHEPRLMRANDGVHMTPAGYQRIAAPLIDRIETYVAQSRVVAGVEPAVQPAAVAAAPAAPAPNPASSS